MSYDTKKQEIENDIKNNKIMLYMKGTRMEPQCGFSAHVAQVLMSHKVTFETKNVLADEDLRSAIKEFSDWPTIPQLYVDGEFVGGCDIVQELNQTGELAKLLGA